MNSYQRYLVFAGEVSVLLVLAVAVVGIRTPVAKPRIDQPRAAVRPFAGRAALIENYGKLPLSFEPARSDTRSGPRSGPRSENETRFVSRGSGYTVALSAAQTILRLRKPGRRSGTESAPELPGPLSQLTRARPVRRHDTYGAFEIRMDLTGADPNAASSGIGRLPGTSNYFIGNDRSKWRTDVPNYAGVRFSRVYPGIDVVYYGNQRRLEHDFVVSAGAEPGAIHIRMQGVDGARIDGEGNLVLNSSGEELRLEKPIAYQDMNGGRRSVPASFILNGARDVSFAVGDYDRGRPLVIDPVISYSTYLGGGGDDHGYGVAVDFSGNAYITGYTDSGDFPVASPLQQSNGTADVFVAKLNNTGTVLLYSTFIGGSGADYANTIAVDSTGAVTLAGYTDSPNFPTKNAFQSAYGGAVSDAFVLRLNSAGSAIAFSTYLGGNSSTIGFGEEAEALAIDAAGNTYVTGYTDSRSFPTTASSYQRALGGVNAFISKFDATGALIYSTYLGGQGVDLPFGIAADSLGNAYVTGGTVGSAFPTVNALQNTAGGGVCGTPPNTLPCGDAFVAKLNPTGTALLYSTYLGGAGTDVAYSIVLDGSGSAYVAGYTQATNFPITNLAAQKNYGGNTDAFVAKLSPAGNSLAYATYLGGTGADRALAIAVSSLGYIYVAGQTGSNAFPVANALQPRRAGDYDAFITVLDPTGAFSYSSFLGGSDYDAALAVAIDRGGNVYVVGETVSTDFPTASPLQKNYSGGTCGASPNTEPCYDAFIVKMSDPTANPVPTVAALSPSSANAGGVAFSLTATGTNFMPQSIVRWNDSARTTTFVTSSQLKASITATDIATAGTAQVTVFNPAPGGGASNAASFSIGTGSPGGPVVPPGSTVNAAGLTPAAPVAAGSIATVFGLNLASTTNGVVTVQVNGLNARIFDVFPTQINFQIPWEVAGQAQANVTVTVDGVTSSPSAVNLASLAPGIFLIGQQGAVLISAEGDTLAAPVGSIAGRVTRPARTGDYITIYCTGLGAVTNQPASGAAASGSPLSTTQTTPAVTIGGVAAPVTEFFFSGLSPGFVGLYQITVQVPPGVPTGDAVTLQFTIGGVASNTAMIAVQ